MDRDDTGMSDRSDEARQGDTGMIGSESEEPGPGRDTALTDPDPVAACADQPLGTVAMSEGEPLRTRLGSHVEGAGEIGDDVTAADPGLAAEPVVDQGAYEREPVVDQGEPGGAGMAGSAEEPGVQDGVFDQEADQARRPSDGV